MEKLLVSQNGQWVLEKATSGSYSVEEPVKIGKKKIVEESTQYAGPAPDMQKDEEGSSVIKQPSIHGLMGKTHAVEVHPDMDHLYNIKGMMKDSGKPHLQLNDIKRAGFSKKIINKLPRDANGKVTADMIDEHIAKLPKKKVEIKVVPYTWGAQQHRKGVPQYTVSVGLHPDTLKSASDKQQAIWDGIKQQQHQLNGHDDQIGWARIDPFKVKDNTTVPNDDHWHIDEMQSDFHSPEKINKYKDIFIDKLSQQFPKDSIKDHYNNLHNSLKDDDMHKLLSHGHDDPQHLIHSAINEFARKNGVESISMDHPLDQADQSNLSTGSYRKNGEIPERYLDRAVEAQLDGFYNDMGKYIEKIYTPEFYNKAMQEATNPNLKSALNKLGYERANDFIGHSLNSSDARDMANDWLDPRYFDDDKKAMKLTDPERHALIEHATDLAREGPNQDDYRHLYHDYLADHGYYEDDPADEEISDEDKLKAYLKEAPVHQLDTYHKRPKKLGAKEVPKKDVLGDDPKDDQETVQYMKLHKTLEEIKKLKTLLEKSNYGPKKGGQYTVADNVRRKAKNVGESEIEGPNKNIKQYTSASTGTAKQQAAAEAKKYTKINRSSPITKPTISPEKAAEYAIPKKFRKDEDIEKSEHISFSPNGQWNIE